jgi:hypothetical protein
MIGAACAFGMLSLLPVNFSYPFFAFALFLSGASMGTFNSPNRAAVMNSLPARYRGAGSGMNSTFMNSGTVFSQGVFFTLMILGLSTALPRAMGSGLEAHGVPPAVAQHIAHLPPVAILFATFLGYNPLQQLLGNQVLGHLPASTAQLLTGRKFFPDLISAPFRSGLREVFAFSVVICLIAAVMSWSRGGRYIAADHEQIAGVPLAGQGPSSAPATAGLTTRTSDNPGINVLDSASASEPQRMP